MLMFVILQVLNDVMLCWFAFRLVCFNMSCLTPGTDVGVSDVVPYELVLYCDMERYCLGWKMHFLPQRMIFTVSCSRVLCDKLLCSMLVRSSSSMCLTQVGPTLSFDTAQLFSVRECV